VNLRSQSEYSDRGNAFTAFRFSFLPRNTRNITNITYVTKTMTTVALYNHNSHGRMEIILNEVKMDSTTCTSNGPTGGATAAADQYSYFHDESATIKLYPAASSIAPPWSMNARVYLESSSTLKSTTPLAGVEHTHTPFADNILKLLSRYPLRRLLIRVGDVASTSITDVNDIISPAQLLREERARGPSGTSVLASFFETENERDQNNNNNDKQRQSKDEYASLLRYLLDNNLFPACGAPLDSVRVRKHGHSIIVHPPKNETKSSGGKKNSVVEVESFLAADAASFCNPGIHAFLLSKGTKAGEGGWGAAANNGACHPDENWGLFDSLFSSSSAALSGLLLRSSLDSVPSSWELKQNKRHSIWIDLDVSDSCYNSHLGSEEDECMIRITRGASYQIGLPSPTLQNVDGNEQRNVLNLSLGDLILGNKREEGSKAWYPCPLSDSSRVSLYMPTGFTNKITAGTGVINNNANGSIDGGLLEFDAMKWEDGYYDLSAPWTQIFQTDQGSKDGKSSSLFGISRTVQRPLGLSSVGTLVSVFRYDQIASLDHSSLVKVESLDVLPGALIKPKIHTLRMLLYEGGGAGKDRFIPPINTNECSSNRYSSVTCSEVMLSDLQNHNLLLNSDGSWLIKRTIMLNPDSSLWMMVDFDEAYLPFQKFPADANRGIDAFPSRATFTIEAAAPITLYSSSLLLLPPVPDMSMPFNVISLSCTLWAFVLGSLLNILVRRATESVKSDFTGEREKRPIDKMKEKLKDKIGRLKRVFRKDAKASVATSTNETAELDAKK
jgi:hypothetical protein